MPLNYELHGSTDPAAGTILLSSGLGGAAGYWQPQLTALAKYRVILYDHRGTGRSQEPLPEKYSIAAMADDVLEILNEVGLEKCIFIGHALGGLVGLDLALRERVRLSRLVVINGWAKVDSHTVRCFAVRKELLLKSGPEAYLKAQPIFLYPAVWLSQNAERMAREEAHHLAHFQGAENLLRRIAALQAFDISDSLGQIHVPTHIMASKDDILVPWTASQVLASRIPGAQFTVAEYGGHCFNLTDPDLFNAALLSYLKD
jgi:aminoacrylate hydrolase